MEIWFFLELDEDVGKLSIANPFNNNLLSNKRPSKLL